MDMASKLSIHRAPAASPTLPIYSSAATSRSWGTSNFTGLLDELAMFKFAYTKTELDTLFNDHCHNQQCWF